MVGGNLAIYHSAKGWFFGLGWWFGILGIPLSNNSFHEGIPEIQNTNPNQQLTISWSNVSSKGGPLPVKSKVTTLFVGVYNRSYSFIMPFIGLIPPFITIVRAHLVVAKPFPPWSWQEAVEFLREACTLNGQRWAAWYNVARALSLLLQAGEKWWWAISTHGQKGRCRVGVVFFWGRKCGGTTCTHVVKCIISTSNYYVVFIYVLYSVAVTCFWSLCYLLFFVLPWLLASAIYVTSA